MKVADIESNGDIYDLSNDLLEYRNNYKEIKLEDNSLETARKLSRFTKGPLICVIDDINNIRKQLIKEYSALPIIWKQSSNHPNNNNYNHYTVKDKIYNNIILVRYYRGEIIFVEEKQIEYVSN